MNIDEFVSALDHIGNKLFPLQAKESLEKLLEFLHAEDLEYINKTCKGFSLPFSTEKLDFRSPQQKIMLPSSKNLPRVSQIQMKRNHSTKVGVHYKKKTLLPCDAVVADFKKNSYSSNLLKKMNPMSFTWQTLSSLPTSDFQYNEQLNDLINTYQDSDDEILNKHYGPLDTK